MIRYRSLICSLLAGTALSAQAVTYYPTRFDDPVPDGCARSDCSLREAVIAANGTVGADTVSLQAGTYTLTRTTGSEAQRDDLDISTAMVIQGSAQGTTISNGIATPTAQTRLIDIQSASVELRSLRLRAGNVSAGRGGCVRATLSILTIGDSSAALCTAPTGSAIGATSGQVSLTNVDVYRNTGAAIALDGTPLVLTDTSIYDNVGTQGGGIAVTGATGSSISSVGASDISNNHAVEGAGIFVRTSVDNNVPITGPAGGWLLIAGNDASIGGGMVAGTPITLRNVHVFENTAPFAAGMHVTSIDARRVMIEGNVSEYGAGGVYLGCYGAHYPCIIAESSFVSNDGGSGNGGGIISSGVFSLTNVSFLRNRAYRGGAIAAAGGNVTFLTHVTSFQDEATIGSSLATVPGSYTPVIVRNSALMGGCDIAPDTSIASNGNNAQLASAPSCGFTQPGDQPALTTTQAQHQFGDFGGGMVIVRHLNSSVLVNAGNGIWCEARDVRGFNRSGACDIGAYEAGATSP
jgi:predicted outer membrane repeat protein